MKKIAERLINLSAFLSLAIGIVLSVGVLLVAILLISSSEGMNLSKLFLGIIVIIIIAIIIFFFFFGIYEFLRYFLKIEKEVKVLEEKTGTNFDNEGGKSARN
jgi:hypothetical protein